MSDQVFQETVHEAVTTLGLAWLVLACLLGLLAAVRLSIRA